MYSHYDKSGKEISDIQRQIRATSRYDLHLGIFGEAPRSSWPKLPITPEYHRSDLHYRLETIIANITEHQKIVHGKRLYHYSSLKNLTSICQHEKLFAHDHLIKNKIMFEPNAFANIDRKNGDANSICLCPGQVDNKAYANFLGVIQPGRCRLTIDISNRYKNGATHTDLFKLADLACCFIYQINFGDLRITISKPSGNVGLYIGILFKECIMETVHLPAHETLFYGNIFSINRFCAVQFINIVSKIRNKQLQANLFDWLNGLNDRALTKILIIFSQGLTLFSEYNFNTVLPLHDIQIKDILMLGQAKIKYDFSGLDEPEYNKVLQLLSTADYSLLGQYKQPVDAQGTIYNSHREYKNLHVFGTQMNNRMIPSLKVNVSNLPENVFATNDYIETRTGVSDNIIVEKNEPENGMRSNL